MRKSEPPVFVAVRERFFPHQNKPIRRRPSSSSSFYCFSSSTRGGRIGGSWLGRRCLVLSQVYQDEKEVEVEVEFFFFFAHGQLHFFSSPTPLSALHTCVAPLSCSSSSPSYWRPEALRLPRCSVGREHREAAKKRGKKMRRCSFASGDDETQCSPLSSRFQLS